VRGRVLAGDGCHGDPELPSDDLRNRPGGHRFVRDRVRTAPAGASSSASRNSRAASIRWTAFQRLARNPNTRETVTPRCVLLWRGDFL
jgi:hypothetical protein